MATTTETVRKVSGGSFLIEDITPEQIFTYEDLTDEHRDIGRTVDAFWATEVVMVAIPVLVLNRTRSLINEISKI